MKKPLIFHIQKYSIHDGDGIRTTVFFKGCPLSCKWCHNPESQQYQKELLFYKDRCTGCGSCAAACPKQAREGRCLMCGACTIACTHGAREMVGEAYEISELVKELEKDRMFYEQSGGGITLSGGEVLSQDMDYIEALAERLYQKGYSVNIDTCGHVPYEHIRRVLPFTDAFLYDLKLLSDEEHKKQTGAGSGLILENLKKLNADGGKIHIRLPLIAGVNANKEHLRNVIQFLKENKILACRIHLLKYHDAGSGKYERLGRTYEKAAFAPPGEEWMKGAVNFFAEHGFRNVQIGG